MKYDAVIFDLFGTLVDNMPTFIFHEVLAKMAEAVGAPAQEFIPMWTTTWPLRSVGKLNSLPAVIEYICRELQVPPPTDEQIQVAAQMRYEFSRQSLMPRHDAVETLSYLKAEGYKLGLISDCTAEIPLLWQTTPLSTLIDVSIFSCSVGLKKPDPRIFHLVCDRLSVLPQKCLFVGDGGSNELSGASAVGMCPVMIRVPYENDTNVRRHDEDTWQGATITTLKDILPFVDEALCAD